MNISYHLVCAGESEDGRLTQTGRSQMRHVATKIMWEGGRSLPSEVLYVSEGAIESAEVLATMFGCGCRVAPWGKDATWKDLAAYWDKYFGLFLVVYLQDMSKYSRIAGGFSQMVFTTFPLSVERDQMPDDFLLPGALWQFEGECSRALLLPEWRHPQQGDTEILIKYALSLAESKRFWFDGVRIGTPAAVDDPRWPANLRGCCPYPLFVEVKTAVKLGLNTYTQHVVPGSIEQYSRSLYLANAAKLSQAA